MLLVLFIIGYSIIIYKVLDKGSFKEIRLRIEIKENKDNNLGNKNIVGKPLYIKELVGTIYFYFRYKFILSYPIVYLYLLLLVLDISLTN